MPKTTYSDRGSFHGCHGASGLVVAALLALGACASVTATNTQPDAGEHDVAMDLPAQVDTTLDVLMNQVGAVACADRQETLAALAALPVGRSREEAVAAPRPLFRQPAGPGGTKATRVARCKDSTGR